MPLGETVRVRGRAVLRATGHSGGAGQCEWWWAWQVVSWVPVMGTWYHTCWYDDSPTQPLSLPPNMTLLLTHCFDLIHDFVHRDLLLGFELGLNSHRRIRGRDSRARFMSSCQFPHPEGPRDRGVEGSPTRGQGWQGWVVRTDINVLSIG